MSHILFGTSQANNLHSSLHGNLQRNLEHTAAAAVAVVAEATRNETGIMARLNFMGVILNFLRSLPRPCLCPRRNDRVRDTAVAAFLGCILGALLVNIVIGVQAAREKKKKRTMGGVVGDLGGMGGFSAAGLGLGGFVPGMMGGDKSVGNTPVVGSQQTFGGMAHVQQGRQLQPLEDHLQQRQQVIEQQKHQQHQQQQPKQKQPLAPPPRNSTKQQLQQPRQQMQQLRQPQQRHTEPSLLQQRQQLLEEEEDQPLVRPRSHPEQQQSKASTHRGTRATSLPGTPRPLEAPRMTGLAARPATRRRP